jgi:hypothetical protein
MMVVVSDFVDWSLGMKRDQSGKGSGIVIGKVIGSDEASCSEASGPSVTIESCTTKEGTEEPKRVSECYDNKTVATQEGAKGQKRVSSRAFLQQDS